MLWSAASAQWLKGWKKVKITFLTFLTFSRFMTDLVMGKHMVTIFLKCISFFQTLIYISMKAIVAFDWVDRI